MNTSSLFFGRRRTNMNKIDLNKRTIRFYSEKEKQILTVFNEPAYIYSMNLETDDMISNYKIAVELNKSQFIHIDTVGLRNEMFNQNWYSDFLIQYDDGSLAVRELLDKNKINYLKELRKLEFSRRYWKQQNINDWKIVLYDAENIDMSEVLNNVL